MTQQITTNRFETMSQTFKIALHCWALIDMLPKNITNSPYVRMLISIPEKLKKQPYTGLNISTYDLSHFPCIQPKSIDQCKSFTREELTQTRFDLRMTIFRDGSDEDQKILLGMVETTSPT